MESLPQSRWAGVGAGELSKLRVPPFPKFFRIVSYDPRLAGCETLQTLIMVGPLPAFAVSQVSPAAPGSGDPTPTTFAKGAGFTPRGPKSRRGKLCKMAWSPPGTTFVFQSFASGRWGRRSPSLLEVLHTSQTGEFGVRGRITTTGETDGSPTTWRAAPDIWDLPRALTLCSQPF